MRKRRVLFLCTGNSARSQLAEAFLRHYAGDKFDSHSAGLEPQGINPLTREVMAEVGVSLEGQYSKDLSVYLGKEEFDYLVTVCGNADQRCPVGVPGLGERLRWLFNDPASVTGTEPEKLAKFREIRDMIANKVREWVTQLEAALS